MKYHFDNRQRHWGLTAFLVIAASLLVYYAIFHMGTLIGGIKYILNILAPIIYGVAIAYLLSPVLNFLENRIVFPLMDKYEVQIEKRGRRVTRWICVIFSVLLFLVLIYAMMMMVLPQFIRSIINVIQNMPKYFEATQEWIDKFMKNGVKLSPDMLEMFEQFSAQVQDYLTNNILPQIRSMWDSISGSIIDMLLFLKNFLIGAIVSVYILADKERFVAKAKMITYASLSGSRADFLIRSMRFTHRTFSGFISGKIIDSAIIGVLCYFGLTLLKMPYALLVSVIIGVTNVIPFFGPFIGAIPSFFLIFLVDPVKGLYFLIFILILQQFDGNILGPMILGGSTGLSSFMVIVAIMVGGGIFGAPGMILGVPAFAVLTTGFWKLVERGLQNKQMPADEDNYVNIDRINLTTHEPVILPVIVKEKNVERKNLFMTFWNALMKILKPAGRVLLKILEKIGHYIRIGVTKAWRFLKKYVPLFWQKMKAFFRKTGSILKIIGMKLAAFGRWIGRKIASRKKSDKPKEGDTHGQ